jgi:hypothetical protein
MEDKHRFRSIITYLRRLATMALLGFVAAASAAAESSQPPAADLIVYHGKIVTVDSDFRIVEAMAVGDDRILAVGESAKVLALAGPKTRQIDLGGKTVLPGLIDSHLHIVESAMYEFDHEVPTMETIADVLRFFRQRASVVQPGEWIALQQVFITLSSRGSASSGIPPAPSSTKRRRTTRWLFAPAPMPCSTRWP